MRRSALAGIAALCVAGSTVVTASANVRLRPHPRMTHGTRVVNPRMTH